jgi:hypothetical protein
MRLIFKNVKQDILFLIRRAGYGFERKDAKSREEVFSRRLGGRGYPKFHLYAHKEDDTLIANLHLDQKKPVYSGVTAHSGEYDGELIEQEAERIKFFVNKAIKEK